MATGTTRAPVAREQEVASAPPAWKLTPEEIDRALRSGPRITPSKTDPWVGTPDKPSRWTRQQNATLRRELDLARASDDRRARAVIARLRDLERVETFEHRQPMGRTANGRPIVEKHLCPCLATSRDGKRALIVAPGGDKLWVDTAQPSASHDAAMLGAIATCWLVAAILAPMVLA